ncbi:MAG TPA: hypothetical protein PKI76_06500 [Oscillospiraceae bacterium]|jgi:hypothetical protein|nr:hypothetical protein [Oscillospiraceae bacterium]
MVYVFENSILHVSGEKILNGVLIVWKWVFVKQRKRKQIPSFYAQGDCLPLKDLKDTDRFMTSMFAKMLKKRKDKDEKLNKAIDHIENGFDSVEEENLVPPTNRMVEFKVNLAI